MDTLMALTRYEAGLESPQPEPVDLVAEMGRQARAEAPAAHQRAIRIELDLPTECWVYTDSTRVQRLLANLMDNAVAHSPGGSTVTVTMSEVGEATLANPAPHLEARDVSQLGERFLRIDSEGAGSHAGLGLSLAGAIAKILGLDFGLALRADGQLVASIRGFRLLEHSTAGRSLAALHKTAIPAGLALRDIRPHL
ncbi:MAG: HAMP domain-containing sensor histidine kinase [Steroidobacteraceae bacterium]